MEVFKTDIRDKVEFTRIGYQYKRVFADYSNHIYVYKIISGAPYSQYEVVKARKRKQPNGDTVYCYPGDEDFGTYGWYICGTEEKCQEKINKKITELKERIKL